MFCLHRLGRRVPLHHVHRTSTMTQSYMSSSSRETYDVCSVGGGFGGFASASRLQAKGFRTCVIEQHTAIGGQAGYWRHKGFSFDVGATTLVDFGPGGVCL